MGSYADPAHPGSGGIIGLELDPSGKLEVCSRSGSPAQAGHLVYDATTRVLYAVDERKNDGRGPVGPRAAVHAFAVDPTTAALTWVNSQPAPGPFPTYLSVAADRRVLLCADHGSFDHVERVVRTEDGWNVEYVYDDSTVLLFGLEPDGSIGDLRDLAVLEGHGTDPNASPQAGGHGQSGPHAHCAVLDPTGRFVVVGDKGTDRVLVYALGDGTSLRPAASLHTGPQTGPRHAAFHPSTGRLLMTWEFSSELACFTLDPETGAVTLLDHVSTVGPDHVGLNEPAEVRVHPRLDVVYVNNRGEDTVAWFALDAEGRLSRRGAVRLSPSIHPGLAARSFAFDPTGTVLLVADRPGDVVRAYAVDAADGSLHHLADTEVPQPAFVAFAEPEPDGSTPR
ncbi:beta-propeller fold lactonase family protein [Actinomycetospora sp. TBRC 11914]|uniref:lactonase family protein n=1 Tax=Actinomycetospora sp. TBRC 11914 TaxID=2729387 RepID=UPI001B7D5F77|nr:beta-propeller fold lactonase family protein [Actinomycetospora sp. TBRC 11914]